MYTVDNCPHYGCGNCKYFKVDADRSESLCKRLDHKSVKFAVPWFKSYDCGQSYHLPCDDFEPKHMDYVDAKEWTGFADFWQAYVQAWLPYQNEDILLWFTLHGDTMVEYGVPLKMFLDGSMIQGNTLMAKKKRYYKRTKEGFGYKLIYEEIDGIEIIKGDTNE